MPLFGSHSPKDNQTAVNGHPDHEQDSKDVNRRTSFPGFSRNRDSSPASSGSPGSPRRSGTLLSRFREHTGDSETPFAPDPTIKAARQKVTDAEHAERDADRALELARSAVREARQHVKNLEAAALQEARRARAKQQEAKSIRKGADRLGRHDHT